MGPDTTEIQSRQTETYDALTFRRVAAEEGVDLRSVRRRLRGEPVRGMAGARADRAIARLRAIDPGPIAEARQA
jgi:hypothetical protein